VAIVQKAVGPLGLRLSPPVSRHQVPAVTTVSPTVRHPDRTCTRRCGPAARNPDVPSAIPTVISRDPHRPTRGDWSTNLDDRRWRSSSDVHAPTGGARRRNGDGKSEESGSETSTDSQGHDHASNLGQARHLHIWTATRRERFKRAVRVELAPVSRRASCTRLCVV
jgi:hypothetical protein